MQREHDYLDDYDYHQAESKLKNDFERDYEYGYDGAEYVDAEERKIAALAHMSAWLSLFGGFLVPFSVVVPIAMYFMYRDRSPFIAHHASRALKFQLFMTLGAMLLLVFGSIVWALGAVVAALSIVAIIGLLILPVWLILGALGLFAVGLMPFAMPFIATAAAISVYNGDDYWYPDARNMWARRYVVMDRLSQRRKRG